MIGAADGVVGFEYDGSQYQMVFDMKAIAFFEREAEMSMFDALAEMERVEQLGETPKMSTLAFVMQAGLRRHHPEISAERAFRMAADPAVLKALGVGMKAAMPSPSAVGNAKTPAKPGTKKVNSTRKPSSKRRSKPG